tara:strand:- start:436 stop:804 length:369 start_codon:yes stop_codon:yes gene_type:complete
MAKGKTNRTEFSKVKWNAKAFTLAVNELYRLARIEIPGFQNSCDELRHALKNNKVFQEKFYANCAAIGLGPVEGVFAHFASDVSMAKWKMKNCLRYKWLIEDRLESLGCTQFAPKLNNKLFP